MDKNNKEWIKLQEQRYTAIIILTNILEQPEGITTHVKSAVAASLINMMEKSMTNADDEPVRNLINNSIDSFCLEVEMEKGIENYRQVLEEKVKLAKSILKKIKKVIKQKADETVEREKRIKDGEDILKGICLN